MVEPRTLQTLVDALPARGDQPAVGLRGAFGARWWSYQRLFDEAYRVAALLAERGIGHGERVLLWAPNAPEWAAVLLGATVRGVIVVPVDADASPAYAARLLAATEARLVFHGEAQNVSALGVPTLSLLTLGEHPLPDDRRSLRVPVSPEDVALVQYTSGTTHDPQGVILTHRNVMAQVANFHGWRPLLRVLPVRALVLSPLSHVQGLMLGICVPLWVGVSVLYSTAVDPPHIMRTMRQGRITLLVAVPRLQHLLAEAIQAMPYRNTGMTLAEKAATIRLFTRRRYFWYTQTRALFGHHFWALIVGGAALPPGDERFWFECLYVLAHGYGLTETAAIVSFHLNWPFRRPTRAIGKLPAGDRVRIAADGELLVRGETVTPGLFGNGSAGALPVDADGFLHTGDLVQRGADGRLHFVGRKKEAIVTGEGFNVYPSDVEAVLQRLPAVRDAVVMSVQHGGQEAVHAVLLLDDVLPNRGESAAQTVQQANAALEPHQRIRSWSVWPEADFPRTNLLKVRRRSVEAAIRQSGNSERNAEQSAAEATDADPAPTLQTILDASDRDVRLQRIVRYIRETPPEQLRSVHARPAADLGLSSLDLIELLFLLERETGARLDNTVVHDGTSLAQLQALVRGPATEAAAPTEPTGQAETPELYRRRSLLANRRPLRLLHRLLTPLVIEPWFHWHARLRVEGAQHLAGVEGPVIVAGSHHRHGMDVMAIYCALPPRLRRNLLVVTANETFRAYLEPETAHSLWHRLSTGWLYHVGIPLFFPMALWPHYGTTRRGLMETCEFVERGFSPLIFPEHVAAAADEPIQLGVGWVAAQTGTGVLPVRLSGNDGMDTRSRRRQRTVTVSFAPPVPVEPADTAEGVTAAVQRAFYELARNAEAENTSGC